MGKRVYTSPGPDGSRLLTAYANHGPSAYAAPPLVERFTTNRTLYVNSATGNDSNEGTQAQPFATLARAWRERQRYGALEAELTIQCLGAGPYEMPVMGASACTDTGRVFILGDMEAVTVIATGTITGPAAGFVVPTTAIVAGAAHDFAQIMSGTNAGRIFLLNDSAANSFTVARTNGVTFTAGDQFRIIRPGTELRVTLPAPPQPPNFQTTHPQVCGFYGLLSSGLFADTPLHWFKGFRVTNVGTVRFGVETSQLGLCFMRFECTLAVSGNSAVFTIVLPHARVPGSITGVSATSTLEHCGIVCIASSALFVLGGMLWGPFSVSGSMSTGTGTFAKVISYGGRYGGSLFIGQDTSWEAWGSGQEQLFTSTVKVGSLNARFRINAGTWRFAVTSGPCIQITNGGMASQGLSGVTVLGGTTDPAAAAIDVRARGEFLFFNSVPALTGGTLNADLRTTNVTAANSVLNASNTAVNNAADAILGDRIARTPS